MFPRISLLVSGIAIFLVLARPVAAQPSTAPSVADTPASRAPVERRVSPRQHLGEKGDRALPAVPADSGVVDPTTFARQIRTRFALLNDCPIEVARHQRIAPAALRARRLTLRWTILSSGRVADTAVVATSPVDIRVMDCVKRQMSLWSFTEPQGGPVHVERPFSFRPR
jgi:hypothetical protein